MNHSQKLQYPDAKKVDQVDDYHGVKVADPYRWLEDSDSSDTRQWIEQENKLTATYLQSVKGKDRIKQRLKKLWNYERYDVPFKEGGKYFYSKNDGLQNQSVLYVASTLRSKPRVLLDPNKLSKDGTVALAGLSVSPSGHYLAYGTASSGSDWQEWRVRDISTGRDTNDHLKWIKFSGASWAKDGSGFFYSRYDEPKGQALQEQNYYQKLYFHRIGTKQESDILVYERKDEKEWGFDGHVTEDGRFLIITVWQGTAPENRVFFKELGVKGTPTVEVLPTPDAAHTFVGNVGSVFYFQTDKDAPLGRIVKVNAKRSRELITVVPEAKESLQSASLVGGKLVLNYLKDAHSLIRVFDLRGKLAGTVKLPALGTAAGFSGKPDDSETFYSFTSYTTPSTIYRYDVATNHSSVFRRPKVDFNSNAYETKQVFFKSKDGTRVPMFITSKKGLKPNPHNPTLQYGYGGFDIPETPYFSPENAVWLEMGGTYVTVNLRGGNEYGEAWHKAALREKKQNVFDDFISAAEYLIAHGYTSTPKLACEGASNGGLLIGAMITQRPDLFGATLPSVGVMDMLRFNKFTIGWAWMSEYGNPDDPKDFDFIYKYSPLHNIKPGTHYPPTLIETADHDDRVVPGHSFKFAAALQAAQGGEAPILIRVETKAGHGGGKPISKIIEELSDSYAFLLKALHIELPAEF